MNKLMTQSQATDLAISTETRDLIQQGIAPNTEKAYQTATQKLAAWLNSQILTDGLLATYITGLHHQGKSPATIAQVVAAVKWTASKSRIDVVGEITQRTLAGIRREGKARGRGQVEGIVWSEVDRVCAFAESDNSIAGLRDAALIRLMSDCLLRVSEAVAVNCGAFKKNTLLIAFSKTDQEGRGEALYVGDSTLKLIRRYRSKAGIERGALFRRIRRGDNVTSEQLTPTSARRIIKARAEAAGVNGFISGHSLRVGSAVSLAQAGASVVDMQTAGRWKDPKMPSHYAKAELAERGAIARFRYGKR
jgi:site-specific recombinase XerD